ncbi:AIR synthase [Prochlorococcus sp. MIT 1307]|uniref:AIR synthase n=1 Tax=Prochlorococcus sp. MIT 1307 TaxID=3096219 RepID=UPI002A748186|nr:AIR synthase [Prochlorococcus sp. MIT 1307]
MKKGISLIITSSAAAELGRQASFAGQPGAMHLDLLEDTCDEGWLHIRLQPGQNNGIPVARTDGVTLYAPVEQLDLLKGLRLNYYGDLSGGGFLISPPEGSECCACGAGFRLLAGRKGKKNN